MFLELERRGDEMGYARTPDGFEVDFLERVPGNRRFWSRCARMSRIHRPMTARCEPWQRRRVNIGAPVPCWSRSNRRHRRLACRLPWSGAAPPIGCWASGRRHEEPAARGRLWQQARPQSAMLSDFRWAWSNGTQAGGQACR